MDHASPVFLHCLCKPRRGIPVARAELENGGSIDHTRQLVTVIAAGGTDDGEIVLLRDLLHLLQFRFARRHKRSKILLDRLIIDFTHGFLLVAIRVDNITRDRDSSEGKLYLRISLATGNTFSAHIVYILAEGCRRSPAIKSKSSIPIREMMVTSTYCAPAIFVSSRLTALNSSI